MATIVQRLRAIADELEGLESIQTAPNKETLPSQPSAPVLPATPNPEPKQPVPGVSAQVSLLVDRAMAEALQLKGQGHNVSILIDQIEKIKTSTRETLNRNAMNAVGALADLQDAGVDVSKVREPLHEIEVMSSEGTGGVIEGDLGEVEKGDMTN